MRWENLTIEAEDGARLPGYRDAAVVRRFDAPEALDTRFYEVRAKSVLNRVPEASQMPFRWTVNPYRGCSHACVYCLAGDTPVLMADGRHRPIRMLEAGDEIYGTERDGAHRRYVKTRVLDVWSSIKPAYRVRLDDGTELLASGDHRFLSRRGWQHVTNGGPSGQRPHLTAGATLLGTGRFVDQPADGPDYRRGYLTGLIRGDANLGMYEHPTGTARRLRPALAEHEALDRARVYLDGIDVETSTLSFAAAVGARRPMQAIRTQRRAHVEATSELVAWPEQPTDEWRKGFLAGTFDAGGSCEPAGALRMANCDEDVLRRVVGCLQRFGFDTAIDVTSHGSGLRCVRLRGGLSERMRFFHLTDPAITRKRSIDGVALENPTPRRVVSIEEVGAVMRLFDITTGTGDFIADGVVSHNCFARPTHKYLDFDAGRDFEREIVVKVNAPEVLRVELRRPSWQGEHVAMGTNTDPYQWVESKYRLMPGIWEALRDARNPCSILTKSPLVLRDLDLLREIAAVTSISANLSVPTIERSAWRATEPHTPNPRARLEAVAELNRAGIPTGILVAPLMPGINDDPRQVEEILRAAVDAGATSVGGIALHLRGEVRGVFMDWLRSYRPDLVPRYEELYARGAYAPAEERRRIAALLRQPGVPSPPPFRRDPSFGAPAGAGARLGIDSERGAAGPPAGRPAVQEALF